MQTSPSIAKDFQALMGLLVSLNHTRRRAIDPVIEKALSPAGYLREFCTVHVNIGRCTGKTSFIQFNATDNDFIIVPNLNIKDFYVSEGFLPTKVSTFRHPIPGRPPEKVDVFYVDEPKFCFKTQFELDNFYDVAAMYQAHTIVMVGE